MVENKLYVHGKGSIKKIRKRESYTIGTDRTANFCFVCYYCECDHSPRSESWSKTTPIVSGGGTAWLFPCTLGRAWVIFAGLVTRRMSS